MKIKLKDQYLKEFGLSNMDNIERNVYSIYFYQEQLKYLIRDDSESTTPWLIESYKVDVIDSKLSKYWEMKDLSTNTEIEFMITFPIWIKYADDHLRYFVAPWDYDDKIDIIADLDWLPHWCEMIDQENSN